MFRLPSDGTHELEAAELAVEILGGGPGSRLYDRLVRRDEVATEVWCGVQRFAGGPSSAFVQAMGPDLTAIATALNEELVRMAAEGPAEGETERAVAQAERAYLERTETVSGLANALSHHATLFGDPALLFTAPARAAAVTSADVQAIAARWLLPESGAVLTYSPEGGVA
jgi:predicted Zn-dependent peptidase